MANAVYDPEANDQEADSSNTSGGNSSSTGGGNYNAVSGNELRQNEASGNSGYSSSTAGKPTFFRPPPVGQIRQNEQSGNTSSTGGRGGLYNPEDKQAGRLGRLKGGYQNARGTLQNWKKRAAKHKIITGGLATSGGGIALVLLMLLVIGGALKLPQVTENIEAYEFARVTTQFASTAQRTTDEALAMQAANDSTYAQLKERFFSPVKNAYQSARDSTWGRMDAYRPNKVIKNLGENNGLELHFRTSKVTGRTIFTGGAINGTKFEVKPVEGIAKWVPGLNRILEAKNRANFLRDAFFPHLTEAMKANNTGPLIRGLVADRILKESGGSRLGWSLIRFRNLDGLNAQTEASAQAYKATEAGASQADNAVTAQLSAADEAANNSTKDAVTKWNLSGSSTSGGRRGASTDTLALKRIVSNNGDNPAAVAAAESKLSPSVLHKAIGVANPTYAIFTPLCIIYDGSVERSQPVIDNQSNQQENAFDYLGAGSDRQKIGDKNEDDSGDLAAAIGGTNDQLGDITSSIPYQRAAGSKITTSDIQSAQAGASGSFDYSLINSIGVSPSSFAGKSANYIVGHTCGALTSTYTAGAVALANIVAAIVSFGGSEAGEQAAGQGARAFATAFVKNFVKKVVAKQTVKKGAKTIERGALNRAERFTFQQGIIIGGTYGLTELAHLIVASRSGEANNGLAQGSDLVNMADSGANIEANKLEQRLLFGRPLTCKEIGQLDQSDEEFLAAKNSSMGFSERYFATSNANSLLARTAVSLNTGAGKGVFQSMARLGSSIFKPQSYFGSAFNLNNAVQAAPNPCDQHYGNVQFGWSRAEESLIDGDTSYKPLENRAILESGGSTATEISIAKKYAICFGYEYDPNGNGDLDPTSENGHLKPSPDGTIGHLLASGKIKRDSNGRVIDGGLCSPKNLGVGNKEFGPQMVFRWRLAMRYDTVLDQLIDEQTLGSPSASSQTPATPPAAAGSAQQLAQQILSNSNIDLSSYSASVKADIQAAAAGLPGTAGAKTSSAILKFIATLGQSHKITITAIQSNGHGHTSGSYHYSGDAVDIGAMDGVTVTGRNAPSITIMQLAFTQLPGGTGFGQSNCGVLSGAPYTNNFELPNGDITFADSCNHLHIQVPRGTP